MLCAAAEEPQPIIAAESVKAEPDSSISVPLRITNNSGIAGLCIRITYDTAKLTLTGTENGTALGEAVFLSGGDLNAAPYCLCWDDDALSNNQGSGLLATLQFQVKPNAEGKADISITVDQDSTFDVDFRNVKFNTRSGTVEIAKAAAEEKRRGDLNNDGTVDAADAQLALDAYTAEIAGKPSLLDADAQKAADVNKDGMVNAADAQLILRYYTANTLVHTPLTWEELIRSAGLPELL